MGFEPADRLKGPFDRVDFVLERVNPNQMPMIVNGQDEANSHILGQRWIRQCGVPSFRDAIFKAADITAVDDSYPGRLYPIGSVERVKLRREEALALQNSPLWLDGSPNSF